MATSTIAFQGPLTLSSDLTSASCDFTFTPPSNVSEKNCYVEVKSFGLSWREMYDTPAVTDTYILNSSWPQIQSFSTEPSGTGPLSVYATVSNATPVATTATASNTATIKNDGTTATQPISYFTNQVTTGKVTTTATTTKDKADITVTAATGIQSGMYVNCTAFAAGTYVLSITGTTATLSSNATATNTTAINIDFYTKDVTLASNSASLAVGMPVSSTAVPSGTTVTAVNGATATLSNYVNGANPYISFAGNKLTLSAAVPTGLDVGDLITGTGIPAYTYVTAIDAANNIVTVSNYTTAAVSSITFAQTKITVTSATNLVVGSVISGTGIPSGTTVTDISGTTLTISNPITAALSTTAVSFNNMAVDAKAVGIQPGMVVSVIDGKSTTSVPVLYVSGTNVFFDGAAPTVAATKTVVFSYPLATMTQKFNAPLASLTYRGNTEGAPVLVRIPSGPQTVTFRVSRLDRAQIAKSLAGGLTLLVMATMVAANSRPIPLN